ncbi:hypothetical protein U5801_27725 [Lamprobacter modestohalophilus]|nr:hypothetical protein [Lamprobacter modestohalophilus]MEA1053566.1 hypothetical protein [Lamprobacter modestohalophilus]
MSAKKKFLESEGDAWHLRNRQAKQKHIYPDDVRVIKQITELPSLSKNSRSWKLGVELENVLLGYRPTRDMTAVVLNRPHRLLPALKHLESTRRKALQNIYPMITQPLRLLFSASVCTCAIVQTYSASPARLIEY